jgi:hypothetical protein
VSGMCTDNSTQPSVLLCPLAPLGPNISLWLLVSCHIGEGHPSIVVSCVFYARHMEGSYFSSVLQEHACTPKSNLSLVVLYLHLIFF